MGTTLRHTSTGFLQTTIEATPPDYTLTRAPGIHAPSWQPLPSNLGGDLATLSTSGVQWSLPQAGASGSRSFRVPGEASAARLALAGIERAALGRTLRPAAIAMAQLSKLPLRESSIVSPLVRLNGWFARGSGPGSAQRLYQEMESTIGKHALRRLQSRIEELARSQNDGNVLVLGSAGSAAVYPDPVGGDVRIVVDEIGLGPNGWDIGWLLGEQLEILELIRKSTPDRTPIPEDPVVATLLADATNSLEDICVFAGLRWITHMHDYASYVGWAASLPAGIGRACEVIADPVGALSQIAGATIPSRVAGDGTVK